MKKIKNALVITAHPDDEIGCAGTLILLRKKGFQLHNIILSDAEESGFIKNGKRVRKVNKKEQLKKRSEEYGQAARIIGFHKIHRMGLPNLDFHFSKKLIFPLMEIVRKIRPEVLFILHPKDYMRDHERAAAIGLEVARLSSMSFALHLGDNVRVPAVLYFEGVNPIRRDILIDTSSVGKEKRDVLTCYGSQANSRAFQLMESQIKLNGYYARVQEAEAFEIPENFPVIINPENISK